MTRSKSSRVPNIDEVRSRFEQWRQTRRGKARIPDELWAAAAAIARRDGVNKTAAELRLDGGKLKRRMAAAGSPRKAASPAFVELVASAAHPSTPSNSKAATASCAFTRKARGRRSWPS
jgi:hypothetical protein